MRIVTRISAEKQVSFNSGPAHPSGSAWTKGFILLKAIARIE